MTNETVAVQINSRWRVVLVPKGERWGKTAWLVQQMTDGYWRVEAVFRASGILREFVTAKAGTFDEGAAEALEALPPRCDISGVPKVPRVGKRQLAAQARADKSAAAAAVPRPADAHSAAARAVAPTARAAAFLTWRAEKEEART
jgi:hypothetical protein